MILHIDMSSDEPIYLQIRNQVVMSIGSGELKPGQKMPSVRQLAQDIGINSMTVNKAYTLLKTEGYLEIDRRRGAAVRQTVPQGGKISEELGEKIRLSAAQAAADGVSKEDFLNFCREAAEIMSNDTEG